MHEQEYALPCGTRCASDERISIAANGARWHPNDPYRISCRRAIAKASAYDAIRHLERIVKAGAIEQSFFQDVMRTPRMKEILKRTYPGVIKLREYAGYTGARSPKNRMRS